MPQKEPDLEPRFFFGLTAGLSHSCFFVSDDKVVYRAAGVIVVHDTSNNSQEFVNLNDAHKIITTMDINNRRDQLAVAEAGHKPSVGIYSLSWRRHMQQLAVPADSKATGFVRIKFAFDDLHLAVLTGEPDYIMYMYNTKQSQIKSSVRVIHPPNVVGPVFDMALNPVKLDVCCFVGKGLFRTMVMGDSVWKQYGFHRANKFEFTTACWLNENRVLAGTKDGRLFLVDSGELRAVYNVQTLLDFDSSVAIPNPLNVRPPSRKQDHVQVRHCTRFKNGLMFVVDDYWIHYYKIKDNHKSTFVRSAVFVLSERQETRTKATAADGVDDDGRRPNPINTLCVSPRTAKILCSTDTRLYIKLVSVMADEADVVIEPLGDVLHVGGVAGLSVCDWKPLFMTCGRRDRTVKLWNYERRVLLLSARYADDDVLDVALHPSGLYAVLAFRCRATFVTVHGPAEGLRQRAELVCVAGRAHGGGGGGGGDDGGVGALTRFSASGHMFAVVYGPVVYVYCSVTFRRRFVITGHKAAVTDLVWAANDWQLFTCDADGRVCQFDVYQGKYTSNILFADQAIQGLAVSDDLTLMYTASLDGRLRKIFHWTVTRDQDLGHGALNTIAMSRSNPMLFVTCQYGEVLLVSLPIESSEMGIKEFVIHNQTVSKMRLTADKTTLITCSVDGSICVWDVKNAYRETSVRFPDDIIVSRGDFKRLLDTFAALDAKQKQLSDKSTLDTAKLDRLYEKRFRELDELREATVSREEYHLQMAIAMHEAHKTCLENQIQDMKEKHELHMKEAKEDYEKQLIYEDKRYVDFEKESHRVEELMEKRKEIITNSYKEKMEALAEKFKNDMKEKEELFEKLKQQFAEEKKVMDQEIDEFDDQCDRDVIGLKISFGPKYKKFSEQYKKIQKEINTYKMRIKATRKTNEDFKHLADKYRDDIQRMRSTEKALDATISEKEHEIKECDVAVQDKDALIHAEELSMKESETETLALRHEEEKKSKTRRPLIRILVTLKTNIDGVRSEIKRIENDMWIVKVDTRILKRKIRSGKLEINKLNKLIRENKAVMKKTLIDLHFEFEDAELNMPRLQDYLMRLSLRFENRKMEGNEELFNQRRYLERCAAHLESRKKTVTRRKPLHVKKIEENSVLIAMINKLKKEAAINREKFEGLMNLINHPDESDEMATTESLDSMSFDR